MIARMLVNLLRKTSIFAISFLLVCTSAMPWGGEGHEIVAQIAARKLNLLAKKNIVALLRSDSNDDLHLKTILGSAETPTDAALEKALKTLATWPDHMQPTGKGPTAPWHFLDVGLFEGPSHIEERCPGGDCVTHKITDMIENLKAGKSMTVKNTKPPGNFAVFTPPKEFRFLVHFLGDIHQPLHCVTNADAGGNCIKEQGYTLQFPELHAVWDDALVDENKTLDTAGTIIKEFDGKLAVPAKAPNDIAVESFALAAQAYKEGIPPIPVIDHFVEGVTIKCDLAPKAITDLVLDARKSYDNAATLKVVRTQLYKGGVRLAAILNGLYDHP